MNSERAALVRFSSSIFLVAMFLLGSYCNLSSANEILAAKNNAQELVSVCKEFPESIVTEQSLSDAMDECWNCCANETDRAKELIKYNVVNKDCLCTHVNKHSSNKRN